MVDMRLIEIMFRAMRRARRRVSPPGADGCCEGRQKIGDVAFDRRAKQAIAHRRKLAAQPQIRPVGKLRHQVARLQGEVRAVPFAKPAPAPLQRVRTPR